MEERIHPLISSKCRGYAHHQVCIHHRECGEHGREENSGFLLQFVIRDNGRDIYLAAGPGGGGDTNDRQRIEFRILFPACFTQAVIPNIARVCCHQRNTFAAVHDRAAAQGHNEITAVVPDRLCAVHDILPGRVRADFIEQDVFHPSQFHLPLHTGQITIFLSGLTIGGDNQGFFARKAFLMQMAQLTCPKEYACRHVKNKIVHKLFLLFDSACILFLNLIILRLILEYSAKSYVCMW